MINNFRNVVCHNNPIYLFNYWRGFKSINYFSSSYVKNKIAVEKIRLCDVMKILIFLNPHKKSSKTWEKFDMKVKDLKNKLNSDDIYNELNSKSPKLILVAMGSPRQEKFIYNAKKVLKDYNWDVP